MIPAHSMKRTASLCRDTLVSMVLSGAVYGLQANTFSASTIEDLELTSPQCLLLALLHSLVTEDLMSSIFLAEICRSVQRLRSRHFRVWLLEDFDFPRSDMENGLTFLNKLVADGTMKLPTHIMTIMTSLAKKYNIAGVELRTVSEVPLSLI